MKKLLIILIIIIATVGILLIIRSPEDTWICVNGEWIKHGIPSASIPTKPCPGAKTIIKGFQDCLAAGYLVMESYPRRCQTPQGQTFTEDIGNELEKADLIRLDNPRPNQTITSPLEINGQARGYWYFEASFPIRLLDADGNEIATAIAQAKADWMTEDFVLFVATLEFSLPQTEQGTLVLEKDNPSGLPENADKLWIPVIFGQIETTTVKAFFNNDRLDPEFSCNKVFPVERTISKTQAVARAALQELLKGPTETEKEQGFFTSINPGVKIQSLTIKDGVAKVEFDQQLEFQVGGSCRVAAIRWQIIETLKQFPTVNNVIISIDGRTEDILQP